MSTYGDEAEMEARGRAAVAEYRHLVVHAEQQARSMVEQAYGVILGWSHPDGGGPSEPVAVRVDPQRPTADRLLTLADRLSTRTLADHDQTRAALRDLKGARQ